MKFILCDNQRLQNCIAHISNLPTDKGLAVEIYEVKKRKTRSQECLWHDWIDLMAKENFDCPKRMKDTVKEEILGLESYICPLTKQIKYRQYETSLLTKEQYSRLMAQTQVLAIDYFGLILPTLEDRE